MKTPRALQTTRVSPGDEIVNYWLVRPGKLGEWFLGVPLGEGDFVLVVCRKHRSDVVSMIPSDGWGR